MSGPRDVLTIQTELNRQSLVDVGKRLTVLEHQLISLGEETVDLKFLTDKSNETAKRLQGMVKGLIARKSATASD